MDEDKQDDDKDIKTPWPKPKTATLILFDMFILMYKMVNGNDGKNASSYVWVVQNEKFIFDLMLLPCKL